MANDDPHYHGHRRRLRERFVKSGLDGFADYEVVERFSPSPNTELIPEEVRKKVRK